MAPILFISRKSFYYRSIFAILDRVLFILSMYQYWQYTPGVLIGYRFCVSVNLLQGAVLRHSMLTCDTDLILHRERFCICLHLCVLFWLHVSPGQIKYLCFSCQMFSNKFYCSFYSCTKIDVYRKEWEIVWNKIRLFYWFLWTIRELERFMHIVKLRNRISMHTLSFAWILLLYPQHIYYNVWRAQAIWTHFVYYVCL